MTPAVLRRACATWLVVLAFAVANGALREGILVQTLGAPWAQLLSGLLLSACIVLVAFALVRRLASQSARGYALLGLLWLLLTLAFEFGFGRLVQEKPWTELLAAYRFRDGNIWPIVLLVVLISPWLSARLQGRIAG